MNRSTTPTCIGVSLSPSPSHPARVCASSSNVAKDRIRSPSRRTHVPSTSTYSCPPAIASSASRTLIVTAPRRRRTLRSNQSRSTGSTLTSTSNPSSRTSMARTSSATSHTRPSMPSASTTASKKAGTRHGDSLPVVGGAVHRAESNPRPHNSTRPTISATASSSAQWATGVRERDSP